MTKSVRLNRRHVLKGLGVSLALPWLECMADEPTGDPRRFAEPPRLFVFYVPGTIGVPYWFCEGEGRDYRMSATIRLLQRHREHITVVRGLQHISGLIGGHPHGRNYLTGHNIMAGSGFPNTVSMDQVFARYFGQTYCRSLSISEQGGIGDNTLSRDELGADIPALAAPQDILDALLPPADDTALDGIKRRLAERRTLVEAVREETLALERQLGYNDRQRLRQYIESAHGIEQNILAKQAAIARGVPGVSLDHIDTQSEDHTGGGGVKGKASLVRRIRTVMDLVALGFETDQTRVACYICSGNDNGFAGDHYMECQQWVAETGTAASFRNFGHNVWHWSNGIAPEDYATNPKAKFVAKRDQAMITGLGYLMDKLQSIPARDGDGTLLDYTQIVFGGQQSITHSGVDGPLLIAGGKKLGWKHGLHKIYYRRGDPGRAKVPLSNTWLTILQQAGCPVKSFKESTGPLSELLV